MSEADRLQQLAREGEEILRISMPAKRRQRWRDWSGRVGKALKNLGLPDSEELGLESASLADDVKRLRQLFKQVSSERPEETKQRRSSIPAAPMLDNKIQSIANLMRLNKENGNKFVLMLGAGASFTSGVPPTNKIKQELVDKYGSDIDAPSLDERFDKLWQRTTPEDRNEFLKRYLELDPSPGYLDLAHLIKSEYIDLILTFNFDRLLEEALDKVGVKDVKLIIRGETDESKLETLVRKREPRVKLFKLHGSLRSSDHYAFAADEIFQYPPDTEALLKGITDGNIIMCGYAFADLAVQRAFSTQGGNVVWVNPDPALPAYLRPILKGRKSTDFAIDSGFDQFFAQLRLALEPQQELEPIEPGANPFKFLESYEEDDADWFMERTDESTACLEALDQDQGPKVLLLTGPENAGKTSFVKAGLLPALDETRHHGVELRCKVDVDIDSSLPADLEPLIGNSTKDVESALQRLGQSYGDRKVVLVLDQFERVMEQFSDSKQNENGRDSFCKRLIDVSPDNVTFVLVATDEYALQVIDALTKDKVSFRLIQIEELEADSVKHIVNSLAARCGLEFDDKIVDDLAQQYQPTPKPLDPKKRVTLAHIQAICHILASKRAVRYSDYKQAFQDTLEALHRAINVCDFTSFVEDLPSTDAVWLRNMIRVPLKESKETIAEFIKSHYKELLPK